MNIRFFVFFIALVSHNAFGLLSPADEGFDTLTHIKEAVNKALDYKEKAQYLHAAEQGLDALQLAEALGDSAWIGHAFNSLGNIYKKQNKDSLALAYLLKAYEIRKSINDDPLRIAYSVSNIALMHQKLENYKKALVLHKEAYDLMGALNAISPQSTNARGMGFCYWKLGNTKQAFYYLEKAFSLNIDDIQYEIDRRNTKTNYILGEVYLSVGDFKNAKQHFQNSIDLVIKHGFRDYYYFNYEALSRLYIRLGDTSKAFDFYKKGIAYRDSIITSENLKIMTELNLRYNFEKTALENTQLTIQAKDQQIELTHEQLIKRQLVIGISSAIIIIILISLLLWKNRTQKKRLIQKNLIIQTSLEEKEELVQEIHHRVKNNLQIVSSIFALQLKHIEDESAIKVVRDGMNLVMSMSLVHEKLYIDKTKSGVSVKEYMTELLQSLRKSFHRNNLQFELKVSELVLDIETMIYVGMLMNELITNIFKYAYPNGESGRVHISFEKLNTKEIMLLVADDGIGMDPELTIAGNNKTIGYKLIRSFLIKLRATMEVTSIKGTQVKIILKKFSEI